MKYTLTYDEIRRVLAAVIAEKAGIDVATQDCWFYVEDPNGEVNDVESVEFTTHIEADI